MQNASLPTQRHAVCTLDTLAATCIEARIGSPAIIVIGNVLQGLRELSLPVPQPLPKLDPEHRAA